ncbi:MAG TPA: hypothetical protein VFE46_01760 [Pirellulales bacterium]|jgi:hypothetical protein|nr:hypothetical protein [Pirellulales bacterium]
MSDLDHYETVASAVADGVLIDVSKTANQAGIQVPVFVSHWVWTVCLAAAGGETESAEERRLRMILNRLPLSVIEGKLYDVAPFEVPITIGNDPPVLAELQACRNHDDAGQPIITVILRRKESWEE